MRHTKMMHRSPLTRTATVALSAAVLAAIGTAAQAQSSGNAPVTATVTGSLVGAGRVVTSVSPVALVTGSGLDLSGNLAVTITEVAAAGVNGWNVTLGSSALTGTGLTDIPNSALAVTSRNTTSSDFAGGLSIANGSGSEDLSAARNLFTVNGEATTSIYSGVFLHTSTIDLTIPNGADIGAYAGTLTVTIVE